MVFEIFSKLLRLYLLILSSIPKELLFLSAKMFTMGSGNIFTLKLQFGTLQKNESLKGLRPAVLLVISAAVVFFPKHFHKKKTVQNDRTTDNAFDKIFAVHSLTY